MQKQFLKITAAILLWVFLLPAVVFADSTRQLVRSGNNAYKAGDYGKSLEEYEKAAEAGPDSPVILYNKGNALYKKGLYDEAIEVFEQAAIQSIQTDDQNLEAKSRFNMGNSAYRKAEILRSSDLQKSLEIYEQSAGNYQAALQLNAELIDAGYNLEMARKAANHVLSEIKKQEKLTQQRQDAQDQLSKELNELLQQQQKAAQESSELAESQQQETTPDNTQKATELADEQQALRNRTEELSNKLEQLSEQQNGQPAREKAQNHLNRAVHEQQRAEERLTKNSSDQAAENQEKAAAELLQALNNMDPHQELQEEENSQEGQSPERQDGSQEQTETGQADKQETEEEIEASQVAPANQTAQDILDEEAENRKIRQGRSVTGYQPAEKDW